MSSARPPDVSGKPFEREVREIRVYGTVQGVGFRPTVWRLAREANLRGDVRNDALGVRIRVAGARSQIDRFVGRLKAEAPPLSRIDRIEVAPGRERAELPEEGFRIVESAGGRTRTEVTPDAAICETCRSETLNPRERRFGYPFTNCTHCGPRFSIVEAVPYDRARTSMARFEMCSDCAGEYGDPADRRFHAQPIACWRCGPRTWLVELAGARVDRDPAVDDIEAVGALLLKGAIVALRGLGGFHLACDATQASAVQALRRRKRRDAKPFALMARDLSAVRAHCEVGDEELKLLESPEAPIVLLRARNPSTLPDAIAPGLDRLGFMLPYTPMHVLVLEQVPGPLVMTSANLSDLPQVIGNEQARQTLEGIADYALLHDREIVNRIDDSVVRVFGGEPRLLRRARGYAPAALRLPDGFEDAPDLLAFGGELKSTFCLLKSGNAILSQHQGDLENLETYEDYVKNLALYQALYDHEPAALVADRHPEYLSRKLARQHADRSGLPYVEVQHHHAHVAACLVENRVPRDADPVIGVALDGLGYGDDGAIWGGEFMLADYRDYRRLGTFKPVAMLGGAQAIREPWRNLFAHLKEAVGWRHFETNFDGLEIFRFLESKPRSTLDRMVAKGINAPLASSCGRLFDAVAAAAGLCLDEAKYEAQGAMQLEAAVHRAAPGADREAYRFAIERRDADDLPYLEPRPMWQALLEDLVAQTPVPVIAARFHHGLAEAVATMVEERAGDCAARGQQVRQVALTGGCFQNAVLLEGVTDNLRDRGFEVLTHAHVPTHDGGLAVGQAAIAAARLADGRND